MFFLKKYQENFRQTSEHDFKFATLSNIILKPELQIFSQNEACLHHYKSLGLIS